jgi:hypothetical protein
MTNSNPLLRLTTFALGLFTMVACTSTSTAPSASATDGGVVQEQAACSGSTVSCSDGSLSACEDGASKTISCEEQCKADGFQPGNACSKDGSRCACGDATDVECLDGVNALCTCLDGLPACQGTGILDIYRRCHRDPSSETAAIAKCFRGYKSGDNIACNTAIQRCGSSAPSSGCTANADCGHCERCELSTGKCLTRVACD